MAASPPKKEANPASLRSAAPSKGRGSRGHSLLPMEGGAPKGRRLDGGSGMKESDGDHLKYAIIREHPIHRCAVPLPQWGRLRYEDTAIPISSERIHACVEKQYPWQSLPRVGKVASGASRIGFWRYEREEDCLKYAIIREHPSAADAVPLPQWGRLNRQRLHREYIGGDARRSADKRIPVLNFPNIAHLTTNDKNFSLHLK